MPRNYIRKTSAPSYTAEDINRAVEDVSNKNKTYRAAQEFYGVPASVICQRLTGKRKTPIDSKGRGRKPALSAEIENNIEKCLIARAQYGYPCDLNELQELIKAYVESKGIQTPFKNNKPGDDWYYDFLKRHPPLSVKKPEHLQKLRKDARKPEIIYSFYETLKQTLINKNLNDHEKACFVYNTDESGFPSDPSRIRAIGQKGKPLSRVSGGSGRENTTVLACIGADGSFLPPLIVFKGAAVQPRWISKDGYPGTLYTTSTNGWMEEPQFFQWFSTAFVAHVQKIREEKQLLHQHALLLFDGHASHMSVRILEEAINNNIVLVKLPSHLTDKLQPLDKCVFGPIKTCWEKELISHGKKKMGIGSGRLTKAEFSEFLGTVLVKSMKPANIVSGFKTTGIFPVDSSRFPINEFSTRDVDEFAIHQNKQVQQMFIPDQPSNVHATMSLTSNVIEYQTNISSQPCSSKTNTEPVHVSFDMSNQLSVTQDSTPLTDVPLTEQLEDFQDVLPNDSSNFQVLLDKPSTSHASSATTQATDVCFEMSTNSDLETRFFKKPEQHTAENTTNIRLKKRAYGEVLTTEDVLKRLKEAEEKKQMKKKCVKSQNNVEKPKKNLKKIEKTRNKRKVISSSNKSDIEITYEHESDSSPDDDDDVVEVQKRQLSELTNGNFILASFKGGKRGTTTFKYVCVIENIEGEELEVVGVKSADISRQNFAIVEKDRSYIIIDQVIGLLPVPVNQYKGERFFYHFNKKVPVIEK